MVDRANTGQKAPAKSGPLAGVRVIEFAGIGPSPYCTMLLADMGADVLRIERHGGNGLPNPVVDRGRATMAADIRTPEGRDACIELATMADVVIEGYRPGVMERLGLGPDILCSLNPRLIYGRMTGWGQDGPLSQAAGHDINYIALTGALAATGKPGEPATLPLNLVGDFGGGALFLALGIVAALLERERSGKGQVIDAAIVDGATSLMANLAGFVPGGILSLDRSRNLLGGAAPFYRTYLCADDREIAVGAIEPQFYAELIGKIGAPAEFDHDQTDQGNWAERSKTLAALFRTRPAAEWCELLEGTDACFAPVLEFDEVRDHPHMRARGVHVERDGVVQVAPAPRFSRTPLAIPPASVDAAELIARWRQGA